MSVVSEDAARIGCRWAMRALCAAAVLVGADAARGQSSAYVVNVASNDVSVIDAAANTVVATIPVGREPNGVAVTPDGERVYVSNFEADTVSVIDAATRAVVGTIGVGAGPVGVAVSPDGTRVYVANRASNSVSVIDTATDRVVATVDSGIGPGSNGIAITPDGARAYVNNAFSRNPGTVSVIDTTSGMVVGDVEVARNPKRIAIAPDGQTAYVANFRSWNISVIDIATDTFRAALRISGRTVGVAVHPNGQYAYITNLDGRVEILETSNDLLTVPITVGREPYAIALSGQGGTAYVANLADDTVSVVDLSADVEVATIAVGDKPFAVAWGCIGDDCALPPFTPKPTRTATPTPTITTTPTISPTAPPTSTRAANPDAVLLLLNSPSGRPGDSVELHVTLATRGAAVAGVQLDVSFDPYTAIAARGDGRPDCESNPDIDKDVSSAFLPPGCSGDGCRGARLLVLSLENTDAIADGSVLLSCRIAIAADAPPGTYPLATSDAGSSTPDGEALDTESVAGSVTVRSVPGQSLRQGAEREPADAGRRCSAGFADGRQCEGDGDCPAGVCVIAGSVCDGGADDGLLCDCPGGSCVGDGACAAGGSLGICRGGRADGACCDRDFECGGGRPCVQTATICEGGVAKGLPCLRDEHCPSSACRASGRACFGGTFDRFACLDDRDCPLGACAVAPAPVSGRPDGEQVDSPPSQSGSGGGCTIVPAGVTQPSGAWRARSFPSRSQSGGGGAWECSGSPPHRKLWHVPGIAALEELVQIADPVLTLGLGELVVDRLVVGRCAARRGTHRAGSETSAAAWC